jgi:ABC-type branched-subunit amino acid transport system ATPase component
MRLMMELCDHIYVMSNGSLIFQGSPMEVQNDPGTRDAYFGKGKIGASVN